MAKRNLNKAIQDSLLKLHVNSDVTSLQNKKTVEKQQGQLGPKRSEKEVLS